MDSCIDCLDRTNVVQSALGRHVLSEMLTQLGLVPAASDIENVFNDGGLSVFHAVQKLICSMGKQRRHAQSMLCPYFRFEG